MNAREQMQALLDGKVIMCDGNKFKLDDDGDLMQYMEWGGGEWNKVEGDSFAFDEENYVLDETKCVDFAHALGRMAEGKVMMCLWSENQLRIRDGVLQGLYAGDWAPLTRGELLEENEMESMWMEVEEDE